MVKLVGLTGGIGVGKSTVAEMFRAEGIPVVDADALAREVVEPGLPAHGEIARAWPAVIGPDRRINRKALAALVFADPTRKARLEAITHPRIRARIAEEKRALTAAGHRLAILEAALLVETGIYRELDGLIVVVASPEAQVRRVVARDGCTRDAVLVRLRAQQPTEDKVRVADHVVENEGRLSDTHERVRAVLNVLTADPAH
jgi:dephospho-CoA kinase